MFFQVLGREQKQSKIFSSGLETIETYFGGVQEHYKVPLKDYFYLIKRKKKSNVYIFNFLDEVTSRFAFKNYIT
jgi:hypothetical protein